MKKVKFIIFFIFFAGTLLVGLYIKNTQIPDIKLVCDESTVSSLKCPYNWNSLFNHISKDYNTPIELTKTLKATNIKANSQISFSFTKEPVNFDITMWTDKTVKILPNTQTIGAPDEKGTYVYRVVGNWKHGQVAYIFKINYE